MADYALSSEALIAFGRASTQGGDRFVRWAALEDRIGPSLLPFNIKPECFGEIPFAELGRSPFNPSALVPQPGEMWVLFCFRETFSLVVREETPLRTDGFPLILEWRKDVPDSSLLSPAFHRLAALVRRQIGVESYGLHPAYARYRDNVSFTDPALFGDADDETSSIASAYGALLSGLSAAVAGKRYAFWPFPTMQWDEGRGKLCGVGGLREKLSVAADCSAAVVTVAEEQRRTAEETLKRLKTSSDGDRFNRMRIFGVKSISDSRKLGRNIYEMSIKRTRLVRAAAFSVFCLMTILFAGWLYWWDWNREKIVYYKDYVDKFGVPQGLYEIDKAQIKGRGQTYRMHYQGYDKLLWERKPILHKMFCVNSFDRIIEEKRDLPLHPKTAGQIFFYDENNKLKEVHYVKPNGFETVMVSYLGEKLDYAVATHRGHDGRWGTARSIMNIIGQHSPLEIWRYNINRNKDGYITAVVHQSNNRGGVAVDRNGIVEYKYTLDDLGRVVSQYKKYLRSTDEDVENKCIFEYSAKGDIESKSSFHDEKEISVEEYEYDDYGNLTFVRRVGANRDLKDGVWSMKRIGYDSFGEWIKVEYFNKDGELTNSGVAFICRKVSYDAGRIAIAEEERFAANGDKIKDKEGVFKVITKYNINHQIAEVRQYDDVGNLLPNSARYNYDSFERNCETSCIDDNGDLRLSLENGYAKFVSEYTMLPSNCLKKTFCYFDEKGNGVVPKNIVRSPQEVMICDEFGRVVSIELFGLKGEKIIGGTGFHKVRFSYDPNGWLTGIAYFDENNNPNLATGFGAVEEEISKMVMVVDPAGRILKTSYYGLDGLMNLQAGYAIVEHKYDQDGREIECKLFDKNGAPVDPVGGANHRSEYEYDSKGVKTKGVFTSVNGEKTIEEYDNKGLLKKRSFLKANGELMRDDNGVAVTEYWYDEKGREIKRLFTGDDGKRTLSAELIGGWLSSYDEKGNLCRKSLIGLKDELKCNINRVAIVDFAYDDCNNVIEQTFYNAHTNLVCSRDGDVAGFRWKYDSYGNKIEAYKIDANGKIIKDENGVSIISYVYNAKKQCVERRFLNTLRIRINSKEGVGGWLSEYDERGNEVKRRWIDENDKPCSVNGSYGWVKKYDSWNRVVEYADLDGNGIATFSKLEIEGITIISDKTMISYDHLGRREAWVKSKTAKGFWGADIMAVKYSQAENIECCRFLNNETNLVNSSLGFARRDIKYNEYGECVEESWWDADNNPATSRNSAVHRAELRYHRSKGGLMLEFHWYGTNGYHVVNESQGVSSMKMKFDIQNRLVSVELYGLGNTLGVWKGTNVTKVFCKYDENGRVISIKYKTIDGKGCIGENIAGFEIEYLLNDDKEVLQTFLDVKWEKLDTKRVKMQDVQPLLWVSKFRYSKSFINQYFK